MKNLKSLQNLTKAELISKLETSKVDQNKIESNKDSLIQKMLEIFLLIKSILLKITLIALIIKLLKKYRLIRGLYSIINALIAGIFGISLMDLYGFDLMRDCVWWIRNSSIYMWFSALISSEEKLQTKLPSSENRSMKRIDWSPANSKTRIKQSDIENRWFDRLNETEQIEDNNNNKYYIILAWLIIAGIGFYYRDEIGTVGTSVFDWIKSFRRGPDNPPTPDNFEFRTPGKINNVDGTVNRNIFDRIKYVFEGDDKTKKLKQSVATKFYEVKPSGTLIERSASQETIKPVYSSNLSNAVASSSKIALDSNQSSDMDKYFEETT